MSNSNDLQCLPAERDGTGGSGSAQNPGEIIGNSADSLFATVWKQRRDGVKEPVRPDSFSLRYRNCEASAGQVLLDFVMSLTWRSNPGTKCRLMMYSSGIRDRFCLVFFPSSNTCIKGDKLCEA